MKSKRSVKRHLQRYKRYVNPIPGILGNYDNIVEVPNRSGWVYVRLNNQEVTEVFNNKVPPLLNLQVFIGYSDKEPQLLQVLDLRGGMERTKGGNPVTLTIPAHHETHEWMNPYGGQDVVFVQGRQIMPFRPTPIGSNGFNLYQGVSWINNQWQYFSGTSFDLTNYRPATGALYALLYEDIDATYGLITGTLRDIATLSLSDIPTAPPGTLPIAAVRLWAGSTGIYETRTTTDVIDLRWPFVNSFLRDYDTPSSYSGQADKFVTVKEDETGLEFTAGGASYSTGTFSDPPTDAELDAAFGTAASVGSGFLATLDGGYFVWAHEGSWFYITGTMAS